MNNYLKKSLLIFFTGLLTFGIGNVVFIYLISEKLRFDKNGQALYPMKEAALDLITVGFYGFYWLYRVGRSIDKLDGSMECTHSTVACAVLALPFVRSACIAYTFYRLACANED